MVPVQIKLGSQSFLRLQARLLWRFQMEVDGCCRVIPVAPPIERAIGAKPPRLSSFEVE